MLDKKPARYEVQPVKAPPEGYDHGLYKISRQNVVFGSESNSHFVDVISLGPVGGIQQVYLDESPLTTEEFPKSQLYFHDGRGSSFPWANNFRYAERSISLGKQADITDEGEGNYSVTKFNKKVSSLGVVGVRVNFTTSSFTHKDDKNREKTARARFSVAILDGNGSVVATRSTQYIDFSAKNPTAIQVYTPIPLGSNLENIHWEYRVTMEVRGNYNRTTVNGNWSAATVTEVYVDTQTYDNISYVSGTIVASDVSGRIPKRQYLLSGYQVQVPIYQNIGGNQVLTGDFVRTTSDSPAWNAMAVLTDTLWGGKLPIDKVDLVSFDEFHKYCQEQVNGSKRYSFSQYLIKADNYYKIASEMVGAADGRLYEDTSGRIGVLIDKQESARRVITSYDIVDGTVKRTTVSDNKKINFVEAEFEDQDNVYKKTIIYDQNQDAIDSYGVVTKKIKLDTCTRLSEAQRVIKKMLLISQVTTSSYVFKVGHAHEDVQIGEIVELYDRTYSNVNYCGKILREGSTTTYINIDPRTPINLTGIKQPIFTIDNNRDVPIKVPVQSWDSHSITLSAPLTDLPEDFTSFGVDDGDLTGVKPTLVRVLGVDDSSGVLQLEGIEYNDSLYQHVEEGTPLVVHKYRYIPEQQKQDITNLVIQQNLGGITATWDIISGSYDYGYTWKFIPVGGTIGSVISSGVTSSNSTTVPLPLGEGTYQVQVFPVLSGEQVGDVAIANIQIAAAVGSLLPKPTNFVVLQPDGSVGTEYFTNEFTVQWSQVEESNGVNLSHFKLRIEQDSIQEEFIVDKEQRTFIFSSELLKEVFGAYGREFSLNILAVDSEVRSTATTPLTVTNLPPPAPLVTVEDIGSLQLSYSPEIPTDIIGSEVILWEGTDVGANPPVDFKTVISTTPSTVSIPSGVVKTDGTEYVFDVRWIDSFGKSSNSTRQVVSFNPDIIIPEAPELTTATPIDSQTVHVGFTHDGAFLRVIKASYRILGTTSWTTVSELFYIPPSGTNNGYDQVTESGFVSISGLVRNFTYEFKLNAANVGSGYSEDSNIIIGTPYLDVLLPEDIPDLSVDDLYLIDPTTSIVEGVSDVFGDGQNSTEIINIKQLAISDKIAQAAVIETIKVSVGENTASIVDGQQALADETSARVLAIQELTATVGDNTSQITNTQVALADEVSARATAIQELSALIGENSASIVNTQDALVTETNARVLAVSQLTASVNNNTAQINTAQQAIVDETNARVSAISQLTVSVNNQIALVDEAAKAAIGYCVIGGNPSSQETKALCNAAGGVWVNSTLASSVRTVQVSSGGNTATVGDFYEAYTDLEGNVTGNAVLGVDVNGTFTGMQVVGGNVLSKLTFKGNTVEFQSASGVRALYWDTNDNIWKFSGGLEVGTQISSPVITGGVVNAATLNGGVINAPVINGGTIKLVGTNFMEYWSATPFGANQLIEWYGEKVNGVNWNSSTQQPIPSGMLKSNAKTYKDANGGVYFGGTFQAGTLSSSQTSTQLISTPNTSVVFGSNGGIITIAASYSFGTSKRGNVSGSPEDTAICPASPLLSVVTGTLYLERKDGGNWVIVKQQAISGSYSCSDGEYVGQTGNIPYNAVSNSGSVFTYTDSLGSTANREYRVRASLNNFYYTNTTTQSVSIATSE